MSLRIETSRGVLEFKYIRNIAHPDSVLTHFWDRHETGVNKLSAYPQSFNNSLREVPAESNVVRLDDRRKPHHIMKKVAEVAAVAAVSVGALNVLPEAAAADGTGCGELPSTYTLGADNKLNADGTSVTDSQLVDRIEAALERKYDVVLDVTSVNRLSGQAKEKGAVYSYRASNCDNVGDGGQQQPNVAESSNNSQSQPTSTTPSSSGTKLRPGDSDGIPEYGESEGSTGADHIQLLQNQLNDWRIKMGQAAILPENHNFLNKTLAELRAFAAAHPDVARESGYDPLTLTSLNFSSALGIKLSTFNNTSLDQSPTASIPPAQNNDGGIRTRTCKSRVAVCTAETAAVLIADAAKIIFKQVF